MPRSRPHRITLALLRSLGYVAAAILVLAGLAVAVIQTAWGKNQIRQLIIHELLASGTTLRSIRVIRPRVVAARLPNGVWNLAALLKRETREDQRAGPARP